MLLTPIPPSCMVAPKSTIANIQVSSTKLTINTNIENTKARLDDTALSIWYSRLSSCVSTESFCSLSPSSMNNSPPLKYNYAEQVVAQNNIDIEADNTISTSGPLMYDFAMPPSQTSCAPHKKVPNFTSTDNINSLPEPSPWLFLTVLMFWPTLTFGMATL